MMSSSDLRPNAKASAVKRERPRPASTSAASSLLVLPVSRGARWAQISLILVLDLILICIGAAMISSYIQSCDARSGVSSSPPAVPSSPAEEGAEARP